MNELVKEEDNYEEDDEDEYSQDFDDSDIISVDTSSDHEILSPPSIARLSDKLSIQNDTEERIDAYFGNVFPSIQNENDDPVHSADLKASEAEKFRNEIQIFRLRNNAMDETVKGEPIQSNGILESKREKENFIQEINGTDSKTSNTSGTTLGPEIAERCASAKKIQYTVKHVRSVTKYQSTSPLKQRIGYSTFRIDVLSQPRRERLPPETKTPTRTSTRSSWNEFLQRQQNMERQRQLKLEYMLKQREYNTSVDKLKCSKCDTEQSFDEFFNRNQFCPCGAKYSKNYFHLRRFEERMFRSSVRKQQQIQKILSERQSLLEKGKLRFAAKATREGQDAKLIDHPDDFLRRMAIDLHKRKAKLEELRKQLYDIDKKKCKY